MEYSEDELKELGFFTEERSAFTTANIPAIAAIFEEQKRLLKTKKREIEDYTKTLALMKEGVKKRVKMLEYASATLRNLSDSTAFIDDIMKGL